MDQKNYSRKILIISNPVSGKGKGTRILHEFIEYLTVVAADFVVYETHKAYDVEGVQHTINTTKPDVITIIGGDGTIQNVINAIPDFSIPVQILPGGTGNDLANAYANGRNYRKAFDIVFSTKIRKLDMGVCNGNLFVNGLGIGFDGEIVKRTQRKSTIILPAVWKYHLAVIKGVFSYHEFEAKLDVDEPKYPAKHLMIAVANGIEYGGGFRVAPDAKPDDGLLDVIAISNVPPVKRIFNLPKVKKGKHMELPYITNHRTSQIKITTEKVLPAHLDGEYFEAKDFELSIAKDKLQLLV